MTPRFQFTPLAEKEVRDILLYVADRFGFERAELVRAQPVDRAAGSMAPKVEAACRFVERTGRVGAIGALDAAARLLDGTAGTNVRR